MKKTIIITLAVLLCCSQAYAAPAITGAPQAIEHKKDVVITGSGFGTHMDNSPGDSSTLGVKFDDFDNGVNGSKIENGWSHADDAWSLYYQPRYTNQNQRIGSSLSSYHQFGGTEQGSWIAITSVNTDQAYVSYYRRLHLTNIVEPKNFKLFRFECTYSDPYGFPDLDMAANWDPGPSPTMKVIFYQAQGVSANTYPASYINDRWDRQEVWFIMGEYPVQRFKFWENAQLKNNFQRPEDFPGGIGPIWGNGGNKLNNFIFGFWIRGGSTGSVQMDDIYMDLTQARVEIGNAATWEQCTHREIQIPKAWTDTSITITSNKGSFSDGTTAYLYVVDSNGNVNSQGYPVKFGTSTTLEGDVNGDTKVDIKDLIMVAKDFGKTTGFTPACDVNSDSKVDIKDLILVAKNFGMGG